MRSPRFSALALACALSMPLVPQVFGQDAEALVATQDAAPSKELIQSAEDFWHYASVGRFDLARMQGEKLLSASANPQQVFGAFEAALAARNQGVPAERRVELYERMLAWQRVPELSEVTAKLLTTFNQAKQARRAEPSFIEENVKRLGNGRRPYALAVEQLKESGELAVPIMIDYLKDPSQKALQVPIRSALSDMGYRALNPLLAATEMQDWDTLTWVVSSLGDLGYDVAVPYLARILESKDAPEAVKLAATQSLMRLGYGDPKSVNASQAFYELAEKFYYDKSAVHAVEGHPVAYMWYWRDGRLHKEDVPSAVQNEDMAMRCCEYSLKLDPSRSPAVSLWLASGFKREVEMPQGASDPTWSQGHPDTHYYAVSAGTTHLYPTLARAMADHNSAVAFKAIRSLQEIAGTSNLFAAGTSNPLLEALRYPDRLVRFEAAFAVAGALPQQTFYGQDRVVPILAEALAQTGKPGVLVLNESQDAVNQLSGALSEKYAVRGGTSADAAVAEAEALSGVDVIVVNETDKNIDRLFEAVRNNVRLERAARLVLVKSTVASPFAAMSMNDPLVTVSNASPSDAAALAAAVEEARRRAGILTLDEKSATEYALRSANLLQQLAISRGQVLDLSAAQGALLAALDDTRIEIAKAAGDATALLASPEAQQALAVKSLEGNTPDEMKIAFLNNLATSAKFFGNQLNARQVDALTKMVENAENLSVRSAAAEAHGALNLSAEQVKTLIVNQAR